MTSSTVADDDELEAGVIHYLLVRQRLRQKRKQISQTLTTS
jgi:hypothetical protein